MMWICWVKNTETLIGASKEVALEVNTEKPKYMLLPRHQNAGKNHDIKIAIIFWKCGTVHVFGDDANKAKFDSVRN
jgi:hypothetical protein